MKSDEGLKGLSKAQASAIHNDNNQLKGAETKHQQQQMLSHFPKTISIILFIFFYHQTLTLHLPTSSIQLSHLPISTFYLDSGLSHTKKGSTLKGTKAGNLHIQI